MFTLKLMTIATIALTTAAILFLIVESTISQYNERQARKPD